MMLTMQTGARPAAESGQFVDVAGDPDEWDLRLDEAFPLTDSGDPILQDPDGSTSDIGAFGGPAGYWLP